MKPFVPRADEEFDEWATNFVNYMAAHALELSVSPAEIAQSQAALADWKSALGAHMNAKAVARAARQVKVTTRSTLEPLARAYARRFHANPAVGHPSLAALRLTVPDRVRTRVAVPATAPLVIVRIGGSWQHTLLFYDRREGGAERAKPPGVIGVEIWIAITPQGAAPGNTFALLGIRTRSPYVITHAGEDVGKTAHYMLRWVNRRGEPGPWSETASATIAM